MDSSLEQNIIKVAAQISQKAADMIFKRGQGQYLGFDAVKLICTFDDPIHSSQKIALQHLHLLLKRPLKPFFHGPEYNAIWQLMLDGKNTNAMELFFAYGFVPEPNAAMTQIPITPQIVAQLRLPQYFPTIQAAYLFALIVLVQDEILQWTTPTAEVLRFFSKLSWRYGYLVSMAQPSHQLPLKRSLESFCNGL